MMMYLWTAGLLAVICCFSAVEAQFEPQYRIGGGTEGEPGQFPYQVAIFYGDHFACGGSIIHEKYVLTAGHCIKERPNLRVLVGTNSFTNGTFYVAKKVIKHEDCWLSSSRTYAINDIALIELTTNIQFSLHVQKISLYPTEVENGSSLIISGRGSIQTLWGPYPKSLLFINETKLDPRTCKEHLHNNSLDIVTDGIMCAEAKAGQGACYGDSGGPLVLESKNGHTQVGIASFIFGDHRNCTKSTPTLNVFTKVSYFIDWIEDKIYN